MFFIFLQHYVVYFFYFFFSSCDQLAATAAYGILFNRPVSTQVTPGKGGFSEALPKKFPQGLPV